MNKLDKIIRAAVAVLAFWLVYSFIVRNQLVVEFVRPQVESGKLGLASANVVTSIVEVLAAIGGVILLGITRLLEYITSLINSNVNQLRGSALATDQNVSEDAEDPRKLTADLSRLLIQSVLEGNRSLTIQLAHRLAKKRFLDVDTEDQT